MEEMGAWVAVKEMKVDEECVSKQRAVHRPDLVLTSPVSGSLQRGCRCPSSTSAASSSKHQALPVRHQALPAIVSTHCKALAFIWPSPVD